MPPSPKKRVRTLSARWRISYQSGAEVVITWPASIEESDARLCYPTATAVVPVAAPVKKPSTTESEPPCAAR